MGRLTEAQTKALAWLERGPSTNGINFKTGEALRVRGLAVRDTLFIIRREYADKNGEHLQFHNDAWTVWHEWFITDAGRTALNETEGERK